jgi:hypothetical protein
MRIADHLSEKQKLQPDDIKSLKKKRKQEKVNWPEIKGKNRDTYVRKNGAVRRK